MRRMVVVLAAVGLAACGGGGSTDPADRWVDEMGQLPAEQLVTACSWAKVIAEDRAMFESEWEADYELTYEQFVDAVPRACP